MYHKSGPPIRESRLDELLCSNGAPLADVTSRKPVAKKDRAQGEGKSRCAGIGKGHGRGHGFVGGGQAAANFALHVVSHLSRVFAKNYSTDSGFVNPRCPAKALNGD